MMFRIQDSVDNICFLEPLVAPCSYFFPIYSSRAPQLPMPISSFLIFLLKPILVKDLNLAFTLFLNVSLFQSFVPSLIFFLPPLLQKVCIFYILTCSAGQHSSMAFPKYVLTRIYELICFPKFSSMLRLLKLCFSPPLNLMSTNFKTPTCMRKQCFSRWLAV